MAFELDISTDFEEVCNDFQESVTLRIDSTDTTLPNTMTEPYEIREMDARQQHESGETGTDAQVTKSGTLFIWSKSRSDEPPLGSVIIDSAGTYWTIYRLTNKHHVETWEAFALNLGIVTAAANQATVLKATYTKGEANEALATWYGLWSGVEGGSGEDTVAARFQPSEETARLAFGADNSLETYRVFFESPVPVDLAGGEYRLVDSDGNRYRVMKYFNEERIDKLPVAIAVRITEGEEYHNA